MGDVHILPTARADGIRKRERGIEKAQELAAICRRATGVSVSLSRVEVWFKHEAEAQALFDLLKGPSK